MSDKISYILEVLDGYSKETSKFKKELDSLNKSAKTLEKSLKSLNSALNFKSNVSQANKLSGVFSGFGAGNASAFKSQSSSAKKQFKEAEQFSAQAVRSAEIISRNKRAYYQKMARNEVDEMGGRKIGPRSPLGIGTTAFAMGGSSSNSYSSPIRHKVLAIEDLTKATEKLNQTEERSSRIHRNSRRAFAGAYTPVRFDPYEGKYVGKFQPDPNAPKFGYGMAGGMLGRGMMGAGSLMAGMGIATGVYAAGKSVKYVHDTTVQMDSLRASLSALIPKVKGLEGATPEGEIQYLRGVSNKYGLNFSDIAPSYIKILGTGGKIDASLAKGLVESIGGYSGLLGLSGPATQDTLRGFQDMLTKQVLQAQEVNLQMQQLPGVKPMLHKAFFRIAQRQGDKRVTMDNASQEFQKSMSTGQLSSALMLKELVKVIQEEFGQKMLDKANKLGNEEKRLASATQELATTLGDLAYPATIGAVRGMNSVVKGVNSFIGDLQSSRDTLGDFFNNKQDEKNKGWLDKLRQENPNPYGFKYTGNILGKGLTAANEVAKLPVNTLYEGAMGAISGDWSGVSKPMKEFNDYFGFTDLINSVNSLTSAILGQGQDKQKVEVKISTENMPDFFSVQTSQPNMSMWRPSTIIAGQR